MEVRQVRRRLLYKHCFVGPHLRQGCEDIGGGGDPAPLARRRTRVSRWMGRHALRACPYRPPCRSRGFHQANERFGRENGVGYQAIAYRRTSRFGRIVADMEKLKAVRQILASYIGVVAENRCADDNRDVMTTQLIGERSDRKRQTACIERVIFREGRAFAGRSRPNRCIQFFRQSHGGGPAIPPVNRRAKNNGRIGSSRKLLREHL